MFFEIIQQRHSKFPSATVPPYSETDASSLEGASFAAAYFEVSHLKKATFRLPELYAESLMDAGDPDDDRTILM